MPAFTSRHALALLALTVCQLLTRASFAGKGGAYPFGDGGFEASLFLSQIDASLGLLVSMFVAGMVVATVVGALSGQRSYSAQVRSQSLESTHV